MEAVMRQLAISHPPGRRTYDIAAAVKVRTRLTAEELTKKGRLAWKNLRYKHLLMASSVMGGNWVYNVPYGKELEAWTEKTFLSVGSTPKRTEYVLKILSPVELPILLHFKDRNEFLLKLSHCHLGGHGITMWYNDFLHELSHPTMNTIRWKPGEEVKNLPLETHRFSVKETETIIAGARNLGLTLTPFGHAAIALAAKEQGNLPDGVQHNTFIVQASEGSAKGPPELGSDAAAMRFGLLPIQIDIHDFPQTSKALMECYFAYKKNMTSYTPIMANALADMDTDVVNDVMSTFIISNMGDLSPYIRASYGEIELADYWAITLPANSSILISMETRLGQLEIRVCYNGSYYDSSRIRSLLKSACKILLDAST
ncbi:polyketide synthase dehydratase family protein [Aspergillus niger]|nr:polyketide synthase dehydratase family protein [Aspergillus niger]